MSLIFFILSLCAMAGVLIVLFAGLIVMTKGGDLNQKYGNKLMQARVMLQGLAIILFILAVVTTGK